MTTSRAAWLELRSLLAVMRPDWPAELTERAIDGAQLVAAPFTATAFEALRQAADPECGRLVLTARRPLEQPAADEARVAAREAARAAIRGGAS